MRPRACGTTTMRTRPCLPRCLLPAGLIPTAAEQELMAEWNALPAEKRLERPAAPLMQDRS